MQHQLAEVTPIQEADRLSAILSDVPRKSEILAPLSQILWGDESRRTVDQPGSTRLTLDLGALGTGFVSDDPQLLSLAWAMSR
ncbi:MAG: hypothetical protein JWN70_6553 [Planctomycetaceae bacterium]|nr:hypothetical protein [Planctomycetaceae bacterium]